MSLTKPELQLTSLLLDLASDEFSNHVCNDFELPNTQEMVDLLNRIEAWNVGPGQKPEEVHVFDSSKKTLYSTDWLLMRYFSARLIGVGGAR